jgi:hypothetical protein
MNFFSNILDKIHKQNYTTGLFLLVLSVSGNFIAETLSCRTRSLLTHSMIAKNILILFLIYFTIDFTSDEIINPTTQIIHAFYIWIFFLMFTKMNIYFTVCTFLLLTVLYTLKKYKNYYKKQKQKQNYFQTDKISKIVEGTMLMTVIIGFIQYFIVQKKDHKNFSYLKFILGKELCDHK